ncbi:hypothetical protein [Brucella pituitosa]|uniref:Uncharacterized protein n=1 Tax=Brucella pituitosa TaxID=571256 RepID=A0ABS3K240_9HYPH|nr:hypothetical protein [Brucella pituitosa]MBO1040415.1 hypothetical protein [Brucella pituitosa]
MEARVTKSFWGVPEGDIYPRRHGVGETVTGRMADVALDQRWAEPVIDVKGKRRGGNA